jgi:hypothetical protein
MIGRTPTAKAAKTANPSPKRTYRKRPVADVIVMVQRWRMRTGFFSAALFAHLACGTSAFAQTRAQSSPEDRQRFVSAVESLESAPMSPKLQDDRAWAIQWLTDAPDISVAACLDSLGGVSEKSYAQAPKIIVQYMIAMAAFIIKTPGKKNDPVAQQLAGVESALSAYQAIRTAGGSARSSALEKLLEIKSEGKLLDFVRRANQRCLAQGAEELSPTMTPSESAVWEKIWDQPEVAVMYADRSSVTGSGEFRSITTRTIYRSPLPEGNIAERVRVEEFDCVNHKSRIRRVAIVTNNGRPMQSVEWAAGKSEWQTYEADSLGAEKNRIACSLANHAD